MANTTGKKFGGRKKGTPNKNAAQAREAISMFVENNVHRFEEWLDKIAEENPEKAFTLLQSLLEYHMPKISRIEQQQLDKNGKPADPSISLSPAEAYRVMTQGN